MLINRLKQAYKWLMFEWQIAEWAYWGNVQAVERDERDEFTIRRHVKFVRVVLFVFSMLHFAVLACVCRLRDHDVVSIDSWCTPDSGGEVHACRRCGREWTTTYY